MIQQCNVASLFDWIAIDIAEPFPETDRGNKYIFMVMDNISKWVQAYPLPNQGPATVNKALVKDWAVLKSF